MSPPSNPTPAAIDAFVKQVIGWSHLLQLCADAALERAHVQFDAGDIGFADYNDALQQKLAVVKSCVDMTNAAGSVLLVIAEAEMRPVVDSAKKLEEASQTLAGIQDGVVIVAGIAVAAAALAIAIGAPSAGTIAAAGSSLYKVAAAVVTTSQVD